MRGAIAAAALVASSTALAQTQVQTSQTAAADLRRADATMTAEWARTNAAMKRLDARDPANGFRYAARLLDSQRAWLAFRDKECLIEGGEFAGGSLQATVQLLCQLRLTRERTQQLVRLRWKRP